jgi:hypothetical protein
VVFRALLRWFEDREAQAFLREQVERDRREQAARSGHPIHLCSYGSPSELQTLPDMPQIREGSSPVRRLATLAFENEAELAVTKQRLNKALAAGKRAPTSRKGFLEPDMLLAETSSMLGMLGNMRRVVAAKERGRALQTRQRHPKQKLGSVQWKRTR